ncbi:MAG TPA: nucleoside triphosphate pyrophosphohydrolase [Armatimonadetes bacterium]|nr:nucleoside triphosphate pyrophosphohydrolase [Armatimonadota bacterium]
MNEVDRLVDIMARLRAPGGCPWDAQQTHRALRPYLLEETYEVIEALDRGDFDALRGELGDLLLQIVFHAQIGSEAGAFDLQAIARSINEKLIHRHPHVFGDVEVDGPSQVLVNWEKLKLEESENADRTSALDGIPAELPALARATKIQKKAARVGFDWDDASGPRAKLDEELAELDEAIAAGDERAIEHELGDVLFSICNLARFLSADSESALRSAIGRFSERFARMETLAGEQGVSMADLDIDGLERLWQQAKAVE